MRDVQPPIVGTSVTILVLNDDNSCSNYRGTVTTQDNLHGPLYLLENAEELVDGCPPEALYWRLLIGRDYEGAYWPSSRVTILEEEN